MERKEFVISADVISEELRDYIIHRNLSMHVAYIDERDILIFRTIHAIERHINEVCKAEDEDFRLDMPTLGGKLMSMFNGSLSGYKVGAIKFDNIIPLVHAIFQGNWGIEVELTQSETDPEFWKAEHVGFVKDDPIK